MLNFFKNFLIPGFIFKSGARTDRLNPRPAKGLELFVSRFPFPAAFSRIHQGDGVRQEKGRGFFYCCNFETNKFSDLRAADSVSVPAAARDTVNFISQMENINKIIVFDKKKVSS